MSKKRKITDKTDEPRKKVKRDRDDNGDKNLLEHLPSELKNNIFNELSGNDLKNLLLVSKT